MLLPAALTLAVEAVLGQITAATSVGGGSISHAARVTLAGGRQVLLKWHSGPPAGIFNAERRGLELLRGAGTLRVPEVIAYGPGFIALEWLECGSSSGQVARALGRGLAALHQFTSAKFGLDHDNFIGANPQPNQQADDWVTFFREQRLAYQLELATNNGYLPPQRGRLLDRLLAQLDHWLPARPPASLLHGDLWGGNWLATVQGEPALIDPAVYYGHREAEIAFTELFGGFPPAFYAAYNEAWPLDPSYESRRDLYNLYHLLNHLNLFGEGYGGRVDTILQRYVG